MVVLLVMAVFDCTAPATVADTILCSTGTAAVGDLAEGALVGQTRYGATPETLARLDVRGAEGRAVSFEFDDRGAEWVVWAVFRRATGPWGCEGNRVGVNLPAGVPPWPPAVAGPRELFDLAGRRVVNPRRPGVYFERRGGVRRLVVLR